MTVIGAGEWVRRGALLVCSALLVTAATGTLAANVVAPSRLGRFALATNVNHVKPLPECAGITLVRIEVGSGTFSTTNQEDLALGSAGVDSISARNGDDCVVAGSGNDSINGGTGTDVCIGGLGTDTFSACETTIQ